MDASDQLNDFMRDFGRGDEDGPLIHQQNLPLGFGPFHANPLKGTHDMPSFERIEGNRKMDILDSKCHAGSWSRKRKLEVNKLYRSTSEQDFSQFGETQPFEFAGDYHGESYGRFSWASLYSLSSVPGSPLSEPQTDERSALGTFCGSFDDLKTPLAYSYQDSPFMQGPFDEYDYVEAMGCLSHPYTKSAAEETISEKSEASSETSFVSPVEKPKTRKSRKKKKSVESISSAESASKGSVHQPAVATQNLKAKRDSLNKSKWSKTDTMLLWEGIYTYGNEWRVIKKLFPERTYDQVKDKGRRCLRQQRWKSGRTKEVVDDAGYSAKEIAKSVLGHVVVANER